MKIKTTTIAFTGAVLISLAFICFFPLDLLAAPPEKDICPAPESRGDRAKAVKAACRYFNMVPRSWGLHSAFGTNGEVITCIHFSCSPSAALKEEVKCVFSGSTSMQQCYSEKGRCKGVEACIIEVTGKKGEKVTWKSSCGGYAYTKIDGKSEYAKFKCK